MTVRVSLSLLAPGLAAALGACTTVGPDFVAPKPPAIPIYGMVGDAQPAAMAMDAKTRLAGQWWRTFGSANLNSLMNQALAGSPTVAEALATLERARASQEVEGADHKPRVDVTGGAERQRFNTAAFGFANFPSPTVNLLNFGQTVS